MQLRTHVQAADVHEALRLFKMSTMTAASATPQSTGSEMRLLGDDQQMQVQNAEQFVKQRVPRGANANMMRLLEEGISLGHSDFALRRAINIMSHRAELTEFNKGHQLRRLR